MQNHLLLAVANIKENKKEIDVLATRNRTEINRLMRSNENLRSNLVSFIALFF